MHKSQIKITSSLAHRSSQKGVVPPLVLFALILLSMFAGGAIMKWLTGGGHSTLILISFIVTFGYVLKK
jgi:hypothetical protein